MILLVLLHTITKNLTNLKLKILNLRQNLVQNESSLLKLPGIDVLDSGKRIISSQANKNPVAKSSVERNQSPLLKLPEIDVLDTGKRIQSWLIQTDPKFTKFNEVTQKICDVLSKVTGIEQNNIPAIIYVGLGRAMIRYYNEVLL